jgi:hypothetical protein
MQRYQSNFFPNPQAEINDYRYQGSNRTINFRVRSFNSHVKETVGKIYQLCYEEIDLDAAVKNTFLDLLRTLFGNFWDYYLGEQNNPEKEHLDKIRATEVFKEFLQHLVYYICHNTKLYNNIEFLLTALLEVWPQPFRVQLNKSDTSTLVLWYDPQENCTVLHSVCRTNQLLALQRLRLAAKSVYGGEQTEGFKSLLTYQDKDGFSALCAASNEGHTEIVKYLLTVAKRTYEYDIEGFIGYVMQATNKGYSALHLACARGHLATTQEILNTVKSVLSERGHEKALTAFLEQKNVHNHTALTLARHNRHPEIAEILVADSDNSKQQNNIPFVNHSTSPPKTTDRAIHQDPLSKKRSREEDPKEDHSKKDASGKIMSFTKRFKGENSWREDKENMHNSTARYLEPAKQSVAPSKARAALFPTIPESPHVNDDVQIEFSYQTLLERAKYAVAQEKYEAAVICYEQAALQAPTHKEKCMCYYIAAKIYMIHFPHLVIEITEAFEKSAFYAPTDEIRNLCLTKNNEFLEQNTQHYDAYVSIMC